MTSAWLLSFGVGVLLGGLNFWGLHLTVQKAVTSAKPTRTFLISLLLRMSVLLPCFVLLARRDPVYLLICLLGFLLARKAVLRWTDNRAGENPDAS